LIDGLSGIGSSSRRIDRPGRGLTARVKTGAGCADFGGVAKIKGVTLVETVKFLRRHKDEARAALPPRLRHYLEERVLVGSWYPEADLVPMLRAVAQLAGQSEATFLEAAGRIAARAQAEGIYAHLVNTADLASMPRKAHALWSSQHDSGTFECRIDGPAQVTFTLRGFAVPSREMCSVTGGYVAEILAMIGLREIEVRQTTCCVDGAPVCTWIASFAPQD
jgi:hypothetical protein